MLGVVDDVSRPAIRNSRRRAQPNRQGKGWVLDHVQQRFQLRPIQYGWGIDLEHRHHLIIDRRLLDRGAHEIEGRGVERAADIDYVDAGLSLDVT